MWLMVAMCFVVVDFIGVTRWKWVSAKPHHMIGLGRAHGRA